MELQNDVKGRDPVSEALAGVRIRSTVYCRSQMRAPWGFGVEAHGNPAFHVVVGGHAWLEVEGEPAQIELAAGNFIVLPTGRRYWVRDDPLTPATELEQILTEVPLDEHRRLRYGGSGAQTVLLCGGFGLEGGNGHTVLRALPSVLEMRGVAGRPLPWV